MSHISLSPMTISKWGLQTITKGDLLHVFPAHKTQAVFLAIQNQHSK